MIRDELAPTRIRVNASQGLGELPHNWTYIGYDEINYTYTPGGARIAWKIHGYAGKNHTISAPITCCVPVTVTALTSGALQTSTWKMKQAIPCMIGPLSILFSTRS